MGCSPHQCATIIDKPVVWSEEIKDHALLTEDLEENISAIFVASGCRRCHFALGILIG
jgi:hypothetical protein